MFVVTLLANELVAWMRRQPGTAALRALFYMDEIFGYFPPTAMPPSKLPMLTLMKQAKRFRARGPARDPEPGRPRLQGTFERRHLVHRAPANRARPAARHRRPHERAGGRGIRPGRAREADGRHRAARLPDAERQRRRADPVPHALGTLVAARAADAAGNNAADVIAQGRGTREAGCSRRRNSKACRAPCAACRRAGDIPRGEARHRRSRLPAAHRRDGRAALRGQARRRRQLDAQRLARAARRRQWFAGMGGGHSNSRIWTR